VTDGIVAVAVKSDRRHGRRERRCVDRPRPRAYSGPKNVHLCKCRYRDLAA
jgi:hypothetical protein